MDGDEHVGLFFEVVWVDSREGEWVRAGDVDGTAREGMLEGRYEGDVCSRWRHGRTNKTGNSEDLELADIVAVELIPEDGVLFGVFPGVLYIFVGQGQDRIGSGRVADLRYGL